MPKSPNRGIGKADALCWFGATGDLGYKMTIPALYAMARHGHLNVPVIGIARDALKLVAFEERIRASIDEHGSTATSTAASPFARPCSRTVEPTCRLAVAGSTTRLRRTSIRKPSTRPRR